MRTGVVAVAVIALLFVVACGDGDGNDGGEPTATSSAVVPTDVLSRTGIDAVDAVIAAIEADDVDALISQIVLTPTPCSRALPGHSLACPTGEPEGTVVEAFLHPSCEGTFMIPGEEAVAFVRSATERTERGVYAVYRTTPESAFGTGDFPRVEYAVMLTYELEGRTAGLAVLVGATGIVGLDDDCGLPPDEMAELQRYGEALLAPPAGPSGVREVDAVIEAVLADDQSALRSLVTLRPTECIGPTPSPLGALMCEAGESEGEVINVLPVAECQTHYIRRADLGDVLAFREGTELHAVYTLGEGYAAVFTQRAVEDGPLFGLTVGIEGGGITYLDFGCGQSPEQLLQTVPEEDFLIPPPDGG